jgi:23S rRNA (uracil1939-C5)-methyltransferase
MNALGFHIPDSFDKVLDIRRCYLQPEISNEIRLDVRAFAIEHGLPFYDIRNRVGLLRNMVVRTASTGEIMIIVVFAEDQPEQIALLMNHLRDTFPQITSLMYVINTKGNDSLSDQTALLWSGKDHIYEEMEGLRFKIGPKSFYQTNSRQAHVLYSVARDFAGLTGRELVYDLYTGTGTIANFVSRSARRVVGIEYVPEAIEDAKVNSEVNGIDNTLFYAGDMKDILTTDFIEEHGRPDVIITDPPRAGMHEDVINAILFAAPKVIVYVSCNPATQARDLQALDAKYRVTHIQPVDMFPHTQHVENVVRLELKD